MEQHEATKHLEPTKCTLARHVDPEMGIWPQLHGLQQHAPLYVSSLAASTGKTLPRERWLKDCQGIGRQRMTGGTTSRLQSRSHSRFPCFEAFAAWIGQLDVELTTTKALHMFAWKTTKYNLLEKKCRLSHICAGTREVAKGSSVSA